MRFTRFCQRKKNVYRSSDHLTIGRIKGKAPLRQVDRILTQYETFVTEPFVAKEVILFKSQLTPGSSIYTRMGAVKLIS
jgi:2'-5' RNA ligase